MDLRHLPWSINNELMRLKTDSKGDGKRKHYSNVHSNKVTSVCPLKSGVSHAPKGEKKLSKPPLTLKDSRKVNV